MAAKPTRETEKGRGRSDMVCRARGRVSLTSSRMRVGIAPSARGVRERQHGSDQGSVHRGGQEDAVRDVRRSSEGSVGHGAGSHSITCGTGGGERRPNIC